MESEWGYGAGDCCSPGPGGYTELRWSHGDPSPDMEIGTRRQTLNSVLMWIGSLLILILGALFAGPHFVDWNVYRGVFEEEASRILGRDVRVGGNVNLRLLPAPYVRFEKLQIADTSGIAGAPLFSAESFTMWLSVPPLLKGVLEARRIELEHPSVTLAVDEHGQGNWRSLNAGYGSLPFVPAGVELQSVQISNGTVVMSLQRGGEVARFENINGEVAARKLTGPYTFRGVVEADGVKREVRLATTEPDDTGTIRLNGQVVDPSRANRYTVDLRLSDLWEQPDIAGDMGARIRLPAAGEDVFADIKAKLQAGPLSAELTEISASFENAGQPQIVSGKLLANWGARHKIDVSLTSRWLDLDRLSGVAGVSALPAGEADGEGADAAPVRDLVKVAGPLKTARSLLAGLIDVFPERMDVRAKLAVDQVNLGGEAVGDVLVAIERARGPLEMKQLRAVLPGGARLDFSGKVEASGGTPTFSGDVYIGGASAARVISWALGTNGAPAMSSDGAFAVEGALKLGGSSLQLSNARAEFSGVPIRGSFTWRDTEKDKLLDVALEGREIDTRWIGLDAFEMPAIVDILSASKSAEAERTADEPALPAWLAGGYGDVRLRVRADALRNGDNELRDADIDIALRGSRIEVAKANFETRKGLSVSLEGTIDEPSRAPRGTLRFVVGADGREAAVSLADALGGEASRGRFAERLADLAPFRLAGKLALSERLEQAADIEVDGTASGGTVEARLLLDGGIDYWQDRPTDIQVRVKDGKAARWVANWLGGGDGFETSNSSLDGGSGLLKAMGVPRDGMLTLAKLEGDGFSLVYDGKSGVAEDMLTALSGEFAVNARRSNDVLELVGIRLADGAELGPSQGVVEFERRDGAYVFTPRDMIFAGSRLAGSIAVSRQYGDGHRLEADLTTDLADFPGLMSAILAPPQQGAEAPEATDDDQSVGGRSELANVTQTVQQVISDSAVFSDRLFDLSPLVELTGYIHLKAGRLMINEDMHLDGAKLAIAFGGSRVDLKLDEATALGGEASGQLILERAPAGVTASGTVALQGGDLAKLIRRDGNNAVATGTVDLSAKFTGRALGSRALVSAIAGEGELTFKDAEVRGLDPAIVTRATLALVASDEPIDGFTEALREELGKGSLPVGSRKIGMTIVDGTLRFDPVSLETPSGRTEVITTVDLAALAVDSEWRIKAKSAIEGEADWPPVTVTFTGPLAQLSTFEARVTTDAVERELTVRRMERNVNELERLRRLDEEAAARERERQRKLEEERARAAAEAAAAAAQTAPPDVSYGANSTITSEPLPPIDTGPGWTPVPESERRETGSTLPPEAATRQGDANPLPVQVTQPPAPRPKAAVRNAPELSPSDIMRQQLLGNSD